MGWNSAPSQWPFDSWKSGVQQLLLFENSKYIQPCSFLNNRLFSLGPFLVSLGSPQRRKTDPLFLLRDNRHLWPGWRLRAGLTEADFHGFLQLELRPGFVIYLFSLSSGSLLQILVGDRKQSCTMCVELGMRNFNPWKMVLCSFQTATNQGRFRQWQERSTFPFNSQGAQPCSNATFWMHISPKFPPGQYLL